MRTDRGAPVMEEALAQRAEMNGFTDGWKRPNDSIEIGINDD